MNKQASKYFIVALVILLLLFGTPSSTSAATFIKYFEVGAKDEPYLQAIPDAQNKWQIGYGSTWNYNTNTWVKKGDTITRADAIRFMNLEIAEKRKNIIDSVKVAINNNQLTALISFAYNLGNTVFNRSDLLRYLNGGEPLQKVANEFDRYVYADGKKLPGLVARRKAEKQLFLS